MAQNSIDSGETSFSSWNPAVWPVKTLIPVSFSLLLLQSIAELVHAIQRISGREEAGV